MGRRAPPFNRKASGESMGCHQSKEAQMLKKAGRTTGVACGVCLYATLVVREW